MPDDAATPSASGGAHGAPAGSTVTIPDDIRQKFPELIDFILRSESMNDEERQYWVNILPIMTPEQVENLKGILVNERQQLSAIDAKYSKEIAQVGQEQFLRTVAQERHKRQQQRSQAEQSAKSQEDQTADTLLKQIEEA